MFRYRDFTVYVSFLANTHSNDGTHGSSKDRSKSKKQKLVIFPFLDIILYLDRSLSDSHDKTQDGNQEFVSEDYDTSAVSMDDIRREIEQLTETKNNSNKTSLTKAGSPGKMHPFIIIYKYSSLKI